MFALEEDIVDDIDTGFFEYLLGLGLLVEDMVVGVNFIGSGGLSLDLDLFIVEVVDGQWLLEGSRWGLKFYVHL
jgi:hypothetical protein